MIFGSSQTSVTLARAEMMAGGGVGAASMSEGGRQPDGIREERSVGMEMSVGTRVAKSIEDASWRAAIWRTWTMWGEARTVDAVRAERTSVERILELALWC